VWVVGDLGEQLIFTVNWDTATNEIMSAVAFRDIDCVYETIYLGHTPYPVDIGETLIRYRDFPDTADYHYIADIVYTPISVGFQQNVNLTTAASLRVA
jgi:hypothetical protein